MKHTTAITCALLLLSSLFSISMYATQAAPKPVIGGNMTVATLSDAQVIAAIDNAIHGKYHEFGLTLNDAQTNFFSGLACDTCAVSGFTIIVFTPEQYVENSAAYAHGEMKPFGLADVTPEMRKPVLHVLAQPSKADYINGNGLSMASSVHRVVLTDTGQAEIVQPLEVSNRSIESNSALRSVTYQNAEATFAMSDVMKLRARDAKGEFFIVVVGDSQKKYFKVKEKFAKALFSNTVFVPADQSNTQVATTQVAPLPEAVSPEMMKNSEAGGSSPAAAAAMAVAGRVLTAQERADAVKAGLASVCAVVTTPPGAEIFIDGNKGGVSPMLFVLMKKADTPRIVTIKMSGYKTVEKAYVPDGKTIPIGLLLVKDTQ